MYSWLYFIDSNNPHHSCLIDPTIEATPLQSVAVSFKEKKKVLSKGYLQVQLLVYK